MAPFVYKFKTLKKVKDEQKKKVQKELAVIEGEIDACNSDKENLQNQLIDNRKSITGSGYKISELLFHKGCELVIVKKMENLQEKMNALIDKKDKILIELQQKSKEHKIFDTLEDNLREQFIKEQNQIEMKNLDEIAVQKFMRQES